MEFADGPTGYAFDVACHPPAVENAYAWNAVERGFHAAGARGFERKLRRVEPEVDARGDFPSDFHVVVVEKDGMHGFLESFFGFENFLDEFFSAAVVGMRFSGVDDLKLTGGLGDFAETVEIGKNQVRAFVAGGATREADGKDIGVEFEASFLANGFEEIVFGNEVGGPDFFRRQAEGAAKRIIVFAPGRDVAVE